MFKYILLLLFFINGLFALSLNELKKMPKGVERDFYIWRFISEKNTSKEEAIEAIKLRNRLNGKLINAYYKKTGIKLTLKNRYSPNKEKIKKYQKLISKLHKEKDFYQAWLKLNAKERVELFNLAGRANRKLLNKKIASDKLVEMSRYYAFNQFIYRVERENLQNIQKAIFETDFHKNSKINYKTLMRLGFLALRSNNKKRAKYFFLLAFFKAKDRFSQDKTLFWLYMSSKNIKYLNKLSKSYDYNIYKLLALDFLNKPYPAPDKLSGIINAKKDFNLSNPIEWAKLKRKIFSKKYNLFSLAKEFAYENTIAQYRYILTKANRYKKQYFPIVYKEHLKGFSNDRKALILAIAKQESQFIPSAISKSFALGLMQFMPFLIKDTAKRLGENIELEEMFNPKTAIRYANFHLNYLEKYLHNPYLVALAYNGGIGFTRRLVRDKNYFQKKPYEPYLSMELIKNQESNLYAKKVLANYVIYKMLLNEPVRVSTILNRLINTKAHKF